MLCHPFGQMLAGHGTATVVNTDPYFANVISLLHFDGTNGSTTFTDQKSRSWSASGDAALTTSVVKFGTAAMDCSTGGALSSDAGDSFGTGDFTVEFWFRPDTLTGALNVFDTRDSAGATAPALYTSGSTIRFYTAGADRITSAGILSTGTWYFFALSRVSGTTRLFVDGTQVGSSYTDSNNYVNTKLAYGRAAYTTGGTNGTFDDGRVTKGVGRYSSNFTPPTAAFPDA